MFYSVLKRSVMFEMLKVMINDDGIKTQTFLWTVRGSTGFICSVKNKGNKTKYTQNKTKDKSKYPLGSHSEWAGSRKTLSGLKIKKHRDCLLLPEVINLLALWKWIWLFGPANLIFRLMPPAGLATSPTLTLLCF